MNEWLDKEAHREYHPYAQLFPLMQGDEFEELKDDIANHGLLEAIWLHLDNSIIDGRNRHRACIETETEPRFRIWDSEGSLISFITSMNLHRRHLTSSQLAAVAVEMLPMLEAEAKERQRNAANTARELSGLSKELADSSPFIRKNIEDSYRHSKQLKENRRTYFIRSEDKIKVGISINPEQRLSGLRVGVPDATLLGHIAWHPGSESLIRRTLSEHRVGGEWYHANDNVVAQIEEWLKDELCLVKELTKQANESKATQQAAIIVGSNRQYISDAKKLKQEAPELFEQVRKGHKTIPQAKRELAKRQRAETPPLPTDKYRVFYADPPWSYSNAGIIGETDHYGHVHRHYPSLSIQELCEMGEKIKSITTKDAVLFMWVTSPLLEECFSVVKAWGFKYKTSFVWDKVGHNYGHYNSVRHEFLLVCTRGSCLPDTKELFDSVQSIPKSRKHSEKPERFREIIEALYTQGKRLELFARTEKTGWEGWGNEPG